jgi:hypothetical protein
MLKKDVKWCKKPCRQCKIKSLFLLQLQSLAKARKHLISRYLKPETSASAISPRARDFLQGKRIVRPIHHQRQVKVGIRWTIEM